MLRNDEPQTSALLCVKYCQNIQNIRTTKTGDMMLIPLGATELSHIVYV